MSIPQGSLMQYFDEAYHLSSLGDDHTSLLWRFCRRLKDDPELETWTAEQALEKVENWLSHHRTSWQRSFPEIGETLEDARAALVDVWETVVVPYHGTPVDDAIQRAKATPIRLLRPHPLAGYERFLGIARWMHLLCMPAPFFLSCHHLGNKLRVGAMTISRYRNRAMRDGYLFIAEASINKLRRATRFRFAVERFDDQGNEIDYDPQP